MLPVDFLPDPATRMSSVFVSSLAVPIQNSWPTCFTTSPKAAQGPRVVDVDATLAGGQNPSSRLGSVASG